MKPTNPKLFASLILVAALVPPALGHENHGKAPGEGGEAPTSGPIAITAEAKTNLALQVEEADLRTLEKTALVFGQIAVIPHHSAAVSSRIAGRISEVKVTDGESVQKGQVVVDVESLQIGDPPPRVQYAAPIGGIVIDRHVVQGDSVEPNNHLMEIVDLTEVYAEGRIFEGQVAAVKPGQVVRVSVESYPAETFTGTVDLLSGTLDAETRTLKVWVRIKNPDLKLRPNMRARLHIVTAEADSVIAVPHSAVLGEAGHLFVFVQSDTDELVFERKPVVLGLKDDRYYEVIEGVFPGDKVVTLGNYQLQYVTTRPAAPPSEADAVNAPAAADLAAGGESGEHTHAEESAPPRSLYLPLMAMGITVGVLLLLNLIALLVRRSRYAPESSPVSVASESHRAAVAK